MDCVLKLDRLPEKKPFQPGIRRAPRRDSVLSEHDMEIALKNAQKFPLQKLRAAVAAFARINADMKQGLMNESDALILAIYKSF